VSSREPISAGARVAAAALAREVAKRYAALPPTRAVALGGSTTAGTASADSDVDLYVYALPEIPVADRVRIARAGASRCETDNRFFEPGDEWVDAATGVAVDVMFREPRWIEDQLDRVLVRHEASVGYSTCFWHNIRSSELLFDRDGWFAALQRRAEAPYPEPLRRAVVAKNHPLLRDHISSFLRQVARAVARDDAVSVNHRVAALLASFFDILFAVNRESHPGEKRLVEIAEARCPRRPPELARRVNDLVASIGRHRDNVVSSASSLVDSLDEILAAEGLFPKG
jgi:predicted nucleotidyltransferase